MAYKRLTDAVLGGGLNLLSPGDALPGNDAIALHNWRADQSGNLRSRLASLSISSYPGGAYIHSLYLANVTRYAGADGALYRSGASIATGFDGTPLGFASFQGYLWVMNRAKQVRDDGSAVTSFLTAAAPGAAPTLTLQNGGILPVDKAVTYYVTFQSDDGQETNPYSGTAPSVTPITATPDQRQVLITRPSSSDPLVTYWNVYRVGNTLPNAYMVNYTPIAIGTTTFLDDGNATDVILTERGKVIETDNDPPPAASGLAGPYFGRLLAFNSAAHSNTVWWSKINRPYAWPGADLGEGNHAPVGEEGEAIIAATLHPRHARLYKTRSVWRLSGDPGDDFSTLERTNAEVGLIGPQAICTAGPLDYFQGQEGIYVSNGDTVKKISKKLDPLFRGDFVTLPGAYPVSPLNASETVRAKSSLAIKNGRLYFGYADENASVPNASLVYDTDAQAWSSDERGWSALYYEGQYGELVGALANTTVSLEYNDESVTKHLEYATGYRNQGTNDRQKTYADIAIEHSCVRGKALDQALTVTMLYDNGATLESVGSIVVATVSSSGPKRLRTILPIPLSDGRGVLAKNVSAQIDGNTNYDVTIHSVDVHYYFEARDAKTFDSDETMLGFDGVKGLDTLELDINAAGSVTYDILTDLPGSAMASRLTASISATTGRRIVEIPITSTVEGRLVRLILTTSSTFRLYGARFRHRPYGLYRDGSNGEQWLTQEIGVGV